MLGDKIIVKLFENLLYLTAIGTENQVNIALEECRSREWQNNRKTTLVRRENVDWSTALFSRDTGSKSKLDNIQTNVSL